MSNETTKDHSKKDSIDNKENELLRNDNSAAFLIPLYHVLSFLFLIAGFITVFVKPSNITPVYLGVICFILIQILIRLIIMDLREMKKEEQLKKNDHNQ